VVTWEWLFVRVLTGPDFQRYLTGEGSALAEAGLVPAEGANRAEPWKLAIVVKGRDHV